MAYIIFQLDSEIIDTFPINWQVSETEPHYLSFCKVFWPREDLCFYLCFENFHLKSNDPLFSKCLWSNPRRDYPQSLMCRIIHFRHREKDKKSRSFKIIYKLFYLFPLITILPLKYVSLGIFFSKASFELLSIL